MKTKGLLGDVVLIDDYYNKNKMKINESKEEHQCYFCENEELINCISRSLYHKYNDPQNKETTQIDTLIFNSKDKSILTKKYEEIVILNDEDEHLGKVIQKGQIFSKLIEMMEYYKYRQFVPTFAKSLTNFRITSSLHLFYYDKLKIYYNSIKKNLNLTISQTESSEVSNSMSSSSDFFVNNSQILEEFQNKSEGLYESESKALENVMNFLNKNEESMKKIKTLRTEDCTLQYDFQKLKDKNKILASLGFDIKNEIQKNKKVFFKFVQEEERTRKWIENSSKRKVKNRQNNEEDNKHNNSENIKERNESESINRLKKSISKPESSKDSKIYYKSKYSHEKNYKKSMEKDNVKSVPKIEMKFTIRPKRSLSSSSLMKKESNRLIMKQSGSIKEMNTYEIYKKVRNISIRSKDNKNNNLKMIYKSDKKEIKTPVKANIEIDQSDNLASINRKKIEELKLKSQKKKEYRK